MNLHWAAQNRTMILISYVLFACNYHLSRLLSCCVAPSDLCSLNCTHMLLQWCVLKTGPHRPWIDNATITTHHTHSRACAHTHKMVFQHFRWGRFWHFARQWSLSSETFYIQQISKLQTVNRFQMKILSKLFIRRVSISRVISRENLVWCQSSQNDLVERPII